MQTLRNEMLLNDISFAFIDGKITKEVAIQRAEHLRKITESINWGSIDETLGLINGYEQEDC